MGFLDHNGLALAVGANALLDGWNDAIDRREKRQMYEDQKKRQGMLDEWAMQDRLFNQSQQANQEAMLRANRAYAQNPNLAMMPQSALQDNWARGAGGGANLSMASPEMILQARKAATSAQPKPVEWNIIEMLGENGRPMKVQVHPITGETRTIGRSWEKPETPQRVQPTQLEKLYALYDRLPVGDQRRAQVEQAIEKEITVKAAASGVSAKDVYNDIHGIDMKIASLMSGQDITSQALGKGIPEAIQGLQNKRNQLLIAYKSLGGDMTMFNRPTQPADVTDPSNPLGLTIPGRGKK